MNSYAETVVWEWDGRVVYQRAIKKLSGLIIRIGTAIEGNWTAVMLESAGKVHFTKTNAESLIPKCLFIP